MVRVQDQLPDSLNRSVGRRYDVLLTRIGLRESGSRKCRSVRIPLCEPALCSLSNGVHHRYVVVENFPLKYSRFALAVARRLHGTWCSRFARTGGEGHLFWRL
jgi:hypothetical protein